MLHAGAEPRVYTQVSDSSKMLAVLKEYLSDYNAISKKPMQLVLFQFALEHISHICRIITSPGLASLLLLFLRHHIASVDGPVYPAAGSS